MKYLFISHTSDYSGAPKLLLNLASLLIDKKDLDIDFLVLNKGVGIKQFTDFYNTYFPEDFTRGRKTLTWSNFSFKKWMTSDRYDVILINSIASAWWLKNINKREGQKVLLYVHELNVVSNLFLSDELAIEILKKVDCILYPSNSVFYLYKNIFKNRQSISFINLPYYFNDIELKGRFSRQELIIGGCGTIELRKGIDIFISTAVFLKKNMRMSSFKFVWQASNDNSFDYMLIKDYLSKINASDFIEILPARPQVDDFYYHIDIFLLTSREDPYPLVVIEAARAGVPSICFNKSGGAPEFITNNGLVVEYGSVEQMAEAVVFYNENRSILKEHGLLSRRKFLSIHNNDELVLSAFDKIF